MCGARCLIGRGEASKGARCQLGRDVWFPKKTYVGVEWFNKDILYCKLTM